MPSSYGATRYVRDASEKVREIKARLASFSEKLVLSSSCVVQGKSMEAKKIAESGYLDKEKRVV